MPFKSSRPLDEILDPEAVPVAMRRITGNVGDFMEREVKRNTPVDTSAFRDPNGRKRGTLRASIKRGPITRDRARDAYVVRVTTDDPIAEFVEWNTKPHRIRPRKPGGTLAFRNQKTGGMIFAKGVKHPGTKGAHMFALGAAKTEASVGEIARPALSAFGQMLVRGGTVTLT